MKRERMVTGKIYHVLSRGVDRRKIFDEDRDYLRFIHDLFEFNDQNPVNNATYHFRQNQPKDSRVPYIPMVRRPRKFLVEVLAFTLMPNHYHLLLRPLVENGIVRFMSRINTGYAKYFNHKNDRSGTLFEGRYQSIPVERDAHFIHLPYYIHCNPLDLHSPEWRKRAMKNKKKAIDFLNNYRWSSHLDYCGVKNFPSVTQREALLQFFGGVRGYKKSLEQWNGDFDDKGSGKNIADIALEPI
jgi:putative transposase